MKNNHVELDPFDKYLVPTKLRFVIFQRCFSLGRDVKQILIFVEMIVSHSCPDVGRTILLRLPRTQRRHNVVSTEVQCEKGRSENDGSNETFDVTGRLPGWDVLLRGREEEPIT